MRTEVAWVHVLSMARQVKGDTKDGVPRNDGSAESAMKRVEAPMAAGGRYF